MTVYQYKITVVLDKEHIIIVNMFTEKDMDNEEEKEAYTLELLDNGYVPYELTFKRINNFEHSDSPYFAAACEAIMYSAEFPN